MATDGEVGAFRGGCRRRRWRGSGENWRETALPSVFDPMPRALWRN
jgi:hypothetical protein